MKKRLLLVFVIVFMMLVGAVACTSAPGQTDGPGEPAATTETPAATTDEPAAKSIKFGVSIPNIANPFYNRIMEGFNAGLKPGDENVFMDAGLDPAKQIADIEDMVNSGCAVICIDASDPKGIRAAVDFCISKGVPVIIYDNTVEDPSGCESTIVSDNYSAGYLGGKIMAETILEGEVAVYNFTVSEVCVLRADGFKQAIKDFADGKIVVVNEQDGDPTVDAAMPIMEAILQASPNIKGVWALNDPAAMGCIAAIESAGKIGQIQVVAVDGNPEAKQAILDGKMLATVAQDGVGIGRTVTENCYKVLAGEKIDSEILVPVTLITIDNAAD